jgi:hypothetical protein
MCRRLSRSCLFPAPTSRGVWLCGVEVQARVDPLSLPAHVCSAVATVLKSLLVLCLALVFPVSLTGQLLPSSIAETQMAVSADMQDGCAEPQAPCTGHMPNCVDHICCVTVSALPPPVSTVIPSEWISLDYDLAPESLTGISLKPELSPPILAA